MNKVFIEHNPYKLETIITVDGYELRSDSEIRAIALKAPGCKHAPRLQEWIEEFPKILLKDFNNDLEITFHGTQLDYEDLQIAFEDARKQGNPSIKIKHEPAEETSDKEALLNELFNEIQKMRLFDGNQLLQIEDAFKVARSKEAPVYVVGTMSAGKSTLINAMLRQKLMPPDVEACTAKVTRIKNISNDNAPFKAEVHYKNSGSKKTYDNLTYEIMKDLNSDKEVSHIDVTGNIPFVSSDDVSLVLIDTPGATYALDPQHKAVVDEVLDTESKPLVIYITAGDKYQEKGNEDLLKQVAESMGKGDKKSEGGKQLRDRFIFVLNKADMYQPPDKSPEETLDKMISHLNTNYGIVKPYLFPTVAEHALHIRMIKNRVDVDDNLRDLAEYRTKLLNKNRELHLENYAVLSPSISGDIKRQLDEARIGYDGESNENPDESLIHTGVISIEAAIRQYVQKYAKADKIRILADNFITNLEKQGCLEKWIKIRNENTEKKNEIDEQITSNKERQKSAEEAKKLKNDVDDRVARFNDAFEKEVNDLVIKSQKETSERIEKLLAGDLNAKNYRGKIKNFATFENKCAQSFEKKLDDFIKKNLVDTKNALLTAFQRKLELVNIDVGAKSRDLLEIDPLKLIGGSVASYNEHEIGKLLKHIKAKTKRKKNWDPYDTGLEGLDDTLNKIAEWWEECPPETTITVSPAKTVVDKNKMIKMLSGCKATIQKNGKYAINFAKEQSKKVVELFNIEFKRLDEAIAALLDELEARSNDKRSAEEIIKESERKIYEIEQIKKRVESIRKL